MSRDPRIDACIAGSAGFARPILDIDWIVEAKRVDTRSRRIAQKAEWVAQGRRRNWKYEAC